MKLSINETHTSGELKARFNNLFPYLKIEFVRSSHDAGEGSAKSEIIDEDLTIVQLGGKSGSVHLDERVTVAELEADFEKNIGINVQVFRKSGKIWLETVTTDNWTLQEQNNHAFEKENH